ncbi:MAG: trigger factor [Lachnospiraceae bacterium]|nr:trigger factor [Lachnospiraceae bacterium]
MEKHKDETNMSLSKQRKLERKVAIKKKKRNSVLIKVVIAVVIVAVLGLAGWGIGSSIYKKANAVTASSDFSGQIEESGKIKGVTATEIVDLCDYKNIFVPAKEVEFTDDKVEESIKSTLESHKELSTSADVVAADGDKVQIDFAGTVDGEAFDGGTSTDYDLTLGSKSFIDNFEEQIVGHKVGDKFDVNVTFPEEYPQNPDLAGKPAVFAVTLKGVYVTPEFNDEFVAKNLSDVASSAEDYKVYLKKTNFESSLSEYIRKYLTDNCTVKSYPDDYVDQAKANYKFQEMSSYDYMNQLYAQYYGSSPYASFEDYTKMSDEEYDKSLFEKVERSVKLNLVCQAIAEKEGITATIDEFKANFLKKGGTEDEYNNQLNTYGTPYLVQAMLNTKVIDYLSSEATIG